MREYLHQLRSVFQNMTNSQVRKLVITVSISAVGLSIAVNYFFHVLSLKNKRKVLSKTRHIIQTIPELKQPNVRIKNLNHVELILSNLIHGGKQRLQVISDFDKTITMCEYQKKACLTSNSMFEKSRFIAASMREKFNVLRDHYMAIEMDPKLTREEKIPFMIEWWKKSFDLIVESGVTKEDLKEIVQNSLNDSHLKTGCDWFFYTLERYDIPLVIFSAGFGDIIEEWMLQQCGSFKNQKIVSNFAKFDETTKKVVGFEDQLIHVFNKNETSITDPDFQKYVENRHNLILLGDSIGDLDMSRGLTNINNILKIGFLNNHVEELLPKYMDLYDIVTINDSTFEIPNAILKSVI